MAELGTPKTIVAGAGPAGLTAAYALAGRGESPLVLEAGDRVGGLARTEERDGYRFDLGGHRFFTKNRDVEAIWHQVLGPELLVRPRRSRIRWRGRFIDYPLRPGDVFRKVGPRELVRCGASYAGAVLRPRRDPETFEDWVTQRFGRRLFELFFRSYTEKVWGVPTDEIRAEWAAQRIRTLSLGRAARAALFGEREPSHSLIEEFLYPRLGPGQMWEAMAATVTERGGEVRLSSPVERIELAGGRVQGLVSGGEWHECDELVSSLPLRTIVAISDPPAPAAVREAAAGLRYRDFLTVALVVDGEDPFPDNWVYVHDPEVEVARIQNFRAWSPAMVPEPDRTCVGLEYFCFEGDDLWRTADEKLVEHAAGELERTGLAAAADVRAGYVIRVPKAYPIYDAGYAERIAAIRTWLDDVGGVHQIGRNGLHRYNNSDHSMLTALRLVENLREGAEHDVWAVNADSAYHEERDDDVQPYRRAPATPASSAGLTDELAYGQEIA